MLDSFRQLDFILRKSESAVIRMSEFAVVTFGRAACYNKNVG